MIKYIILCALFLAGCADKKPKASSDDFESLTGKGSPSWEYVQTKEDYAYLELFKGIYNQQKGYLSSPDQEMRIPKVIHFIWLGPRAFPRESVENVRTWVAKHPDWTFIFWTDRERPTPVPGMQIRYVKDFPFLKLRDCFAKSDNFGEQSDVLRYEILCQEGGVYVDHDVKCLRPFELLNAAFDFYCGIDMPYTSMLPSCIFTTTNVIGVKPGHPILQRCLETVAEQWDKLQKDYPGEDRDSMLSRVLHRTFWLFGQAVKEKHNSDGNRDIVMPAYYFDAPTEDLAIFARHQYAGTWHQKDSEFEIAVKKRLMTITKKNNLTLLALGGFAVFNTLCFIALFWYLRSHRNRESKN